MPYQAEDLSTGREVCLKRMIVMGDARMNKIAQDEMTLFERVNGNPDIVAFLGSAVLGVGVSNRGCMCLLSAPSPANPPLKSSKEAYIAMEFCPGGNFFGHVSMMAATRDL